MRRDAYDRLLTWKRAPGRKPLVMRGARQTGKTYLLQAFGREQYAATHYFNFERTPDLAGSSSAISIPRASFATSPSSRTSESFPRVR